MTSFAEAVAAGQVSPAEALAIFDQLDSVSVNFMLGAWRGSGFPTGHPMDGLLETYHWHGKRFDSPEQVYPLIFQTRAGGTTCVNPLWAMPVVPWLNRLSGLRGEVLGDLFQLSLGLFSTRHSGARLRMITYRGKESATMIYDCLPIQDIFRRIDDHRVLGLMDAKGMEQPFFFVLQREDGG
jgi:hypothetical protein